ncbi:hypothetical protein C8F01DRAFT_1093833 [Mycena amicta]|nr:hypothetical protein C8F01DRAFT_1093833 [Mycena amicta]
MAMANPPNPRSRQTFIPPAVPLIHSPAQHENAQMVLHSLHALHANALATNSNVARGKIRGGFHQAQPLIQVKLSRVLLFEVGGRPVKPANQDTRYHAFLQSSPKSETVEDLMAKLHANVNSHWIKRFNTSLPPGWIHVYYTNSKTVVSESLLEGTVRELWARSFGVVVADKACKAHLLDIYFMVSVPCQTIDNEHYTALVSKQKRKAGTSLANDQPQPKRAATTVNRSGPSAYRTILKVHMPPTTTMSVCLIDFSIHDSPDGYEIERLEDPELSKIQLNPPSQQGKTKKMSIHLAGKCLDLFQAAAREKDVGIADIHVAKPFLLQEADGDDSVRTFLVDRLLSNTRTIKYLGTDEAGANEDFYGKTCDAFAHYSLWDSHGDLVFVDVQVTFAFENYYILYKLVAKEVPLCSAEPVN